MKMKAALLTDIREIEIEEIDAPGIVQDSDVLIRVAAVGVCGSDVHYYDSGRIGDQVVSFPFVVGHEMTGVVEDVGKAVANVKRGDRIVVDPAISCRGCSQCAKKRYHTCAALKFLGCPGQKAGCLSELIVMPEFCCFPIPDSMTDDEGVLCEPLSIGIYALGLSEAKNDASVGILGCGPIGLSVLAACRETSLRRIYAADILDYRCEAALGIGAMWTGNPARSDITGDIRQGEPEGLDVVFECSGKQEALDVAIRLLAPGGKLMIIGIPSSERWTFRAHDARRIELAIHHVRRQNERTREAIGFMAHNSKTLQGMVTHHFPLRETASCFELVSGYSDGVIKAVIRV